MLASELEVIERAPQEIPPVYAFAANKGHSPLKQFLALPRDTILFMAPRRAPAILCPKGNTENAVSILTSVGFNKLDVSRYAEASRLLQPDVVVGLGDVVRGDNTGSKRAMKMEDRTLRWTRQMVGSSTVEPPGPSTQPIEDAAGGWCSRTAFFAPVPPIPRGLQLSYLNYLDEDVRHQISGLALNDAAIVADPPAGLQDLPRLALDDPSTPHHLIDDVALGIDLFAIPFIGTSTDAGIALDISFPPSKRESMFEDSACRKSMGVDMWLPSHASDLSPLQHGCQCYACLTHHRAYVQHLLSAKEMLGWVLLQLHNLHVMHEFFAGMRASIADGSFDESRKAFGLVYQPRLPERTGQGPRYVASLPPAAQSSVCVRMLIVRRVRGYQFKSTGPGEPRKNPVAYRSLDDASEPAADALDSAAAAGSRDAD